MTHVDLFSGIGGFALAARWAGFETVAFCEIEPYCQKVLRKHWPDVPIYDDVRTFPTDAYRGCYLLTGGFPCQDLSRAGHWRNGGIGIDGERSGLWGELHRVIGEVRPEYVVVENVPALLDRGMGRVLSDLSTFGYDAEWSVVSACALDAPHTRERVFIVAYPRCVNRKRGMVARHVSAQISRAFKEVRREDRQFVKVGTETCGRVPAERWSCEPGVRGMAHGIPNQMDRLHALGNAIVPQVAYPILKAISDLQSGS